MLRMTTSLPLHDDIWSELSSEIQHQQNCRSSIAAVPLQVRVYRLVSRSGTALYIERGFVTVLLFVIHTSCRYWCQHCILLARREMHYERPYIIIALFYVLYNKNMRQHVVVQQQYS